MRTTMVLFCAVQVVAFLWNLLTLDFLAAGVCLVFVCGQAFVTIHSWEDFR